CGFWGMAMLAFNWFAMVGAPSDVAGRRVLISRRPKNAEFQHNPTSQARVVKFVGSDCRGYEREAQARAYSPFVCRSRCRFGEAEKRFGEPNNRAAGVFSDVVRDRSGLAWGMGCSANETGEISEV